jgi:hypothetical protein
MPQMIQIYRVFRMTIVHTLILFSKFYECLQSILMLFDEASLFYSLNFQIW